MEEDRQKCGDDPRKGKVKDIERVARVPRRAPTGKSEVVKDVMDVKVGDRKVSSGVAPGGSCVRKYEGRMVLPQEKDCGGYNNQVGDCSIWTKSPMILWLRRALSSTALVRDFVLGRKGLGDHSISHPVSCRAHRVH